MLSLLSFFKPVNNSYTYEVAKPAKAFINALNRATKKINKIKTIKLPKLLKKYLKKKCDCNTPQGIKPSNKLIGV